MSRIPLRIRLTLAFAAAMALVLAATGVFVYERLASDQDRNIERELSARLAGVIALVRDDGDDIGDPRGDPLKVVGPGGFVQVFLRDNGELVGSNLRELEDEPILEPDELELLLEGRAASFDRDVAAVDERLRLKAAGAVDDGVPFTVLLGASLAERDATLSNLTTVLMVGGPIALLLASLAGYGVAAAALRPVEAMRRRAAAISDSTPGERLPISPARDEVASLGETLNEMLGRLESALERERSFVADASHELRTPLSILQVELDLALREGRSREELREALDSASDETRRLARLAEDLLVLARADGGRLPIKLVETDIAGLLGTVVERFAGRAQAAGRALRLEAPAALRMPVDPLRIEQAVTNMVDNALRHGDGEVTVSAAQQDDGGIELRVSDRGPGFPADFLEHAFERFTRADHARGRGGTGLGLAIAQVIAAAHGGTAGAQNRAEGGAEVRLNLRVSPSDDRSSGMRAQAALHGSLSEAASATPLSGQAGI